MKTGRYGSWRSPITPDQIVAGIVRLGGIEIDGDNLYWIEGRPSEKGRNVILRRTPGGGKKELIPAEMNARSLVHEYGGGDYLIYDGQLIFSNYADQRLYHLNEGGIVRPLTPEGRWRYADGVSDLGRNRLITVREDHTVEGREAINTLVAINLVTYSENSARSKESCLEDGGAGRVLVSGNDFYSSPRISPDGSKLCWLTWNHPLMPWDGTELWVADFDEEGGLIRQRLVAGGSNESIFQPEWGPSGDLVFISDRSGWWNLYSDRDGETEWLCEREADFGQPQWVFGRSTYAINQDGRILCTWLEDGSSRLGLLDPERRVLDPIDTPWTVIEDLRVSGGRAAFTAASPTRLTEIVEYDLKTGLFETIASSGTVEVDLENISVGKAVVFPTGGELTAHAFYYAPQNRDYKAPPDELPPLLVLSHGGPTSSATNGLSLSIQYWTSRGFAVLNVNYGGSTGFGRAYRERLNGSWGIVDVEDCVNGALFLADQRLVDRDRMAIRGGSAGGYTTLCALTFYDVFKAGASHYGVSDLEALEVDTHKFESKYTHSLVAPYPAGADLYRQRSPINHVDRLSAPIIFFQGVEDRIVPPNQAEMMVDALLEKRLPVAYLTFEGEQHGFRQAANIRRALEAEFYFFSKIFGFTPYDRIDPVDIRNL